MTPVIDRWAARVVVASTAALYGATSCRWVLGSDSAEFAAVLARGGVPHPSGYPLYALWLRAFAWLPTAPAHAASLATAALGALSVAGVIWAAARWGASARAAWLAGLAFGLAPITWKLSTEPEAFAANAALAALVIGLAAPGATPRGPWRVGALGLAAGLGLSNHLTIVFLAPTGVVALARAFRAERAGWRAVPLGLLGLAAGLTPYVALRFASRGPDVWAWGETETWQGLLHHALRRDYGALQHGVSGQRDVLGQLGLFAWTLVSGNAFVWLLGASGLAAGRVDGGGRRAGAWGLAASTALAGPLLVSWSNVSMDELALIVMERFHLLPLVPLAVLTAIGLDAWRERLAERRLALDAVVVATALVTASLGWSTIREHHRPTVELWTRRVLAYVPERAVVMGTGDVRVFPLAYARAIGLRPDVVYVDPWLLHYRWYRAWVSSQLGYVVAAPKGTSVDTVAVARQVLDAGRPLYITNPFAVGFDRAFATYPAGPIFRAVPRGASIPEVTEIERDVVATERDDEPEPVDVATWAGDLIEWRARAWLWIADAHGDGGDLDGRRRAYERARALAPWVVSRR